MALGDADRRAQRINVNLRQSVTSARALSFAAADFGGKLGVAVNAASNLAENIARASRNARIAAGAAGIGALVAVLGTVIVATINWRERTKEVAQQIATIQKETAILNAKAAGDTRAESELEIALSMERELEAAKKLESLLRKFPQLQDAIRAKADAARAAATAERKRAFEDAVFEGGGLGFPSSVTTQAELERRRRTAEIERDRDRRIRDIDRNTAGFGGAQRKQLKDQVTDRYESDIRELEYDLAAPSRQLGEHLGRSIAGSIADGIAAAIQSGSIAEGFKTLLGGILVGFGELMIEIGTRSLLAAELLQGVIAALHSFAPAGAIGPALALIAAGAVTKSLGQSLGGGGGRGSRGYGSVGGFSSASATIIDRGLINPLNPAPNIAGLRAAAPINIINPVFIGPNDANAQRQIMDLIDRAVARRGRGWP